MKIGLVVLLCFSTVYSKNLKGCPKSMDVKPCTCTDTPFTYLECKHLNDAEVLGKVFARSTKYHFQEVHIEYSAIAYLPHEMFDQVTIRELHLKNVTLGQLFNKTPNRFDDLDLLHLENTRLVRGSLWPLLEPMKKLQILNVYFNNVNKIEPSFTRSAPMSLRQISFYESKTRLIMPGTFKSLGLIEKVSFDNCELEKLSRDIFPNPSNVQFLYFSRNKLKMIPDDMFTNMPKLRTVGLSHNQLSVVPPTAFIGTFKITLYISLEGNPLVCDCRLAWLINMKPLSLGGICDLPTKFHGKHLRELDPKNFKC